MSFEVCILWELIDGCETFDGFCRQMVPAVTANDKIPEAINKKLVTIQKLVAHSYYEYEFLDVAMLVTFQSLELALHLKYKSTYPNKQGLKNLTPYLGWATKEKIITEKHKDALAHMRNSLTHPKEESSLGIVGINTIKIIVKLIEKIFGK